MVKCHNKPTETFIHGVISMIRIMSLGQIKGGDVYEIAYARSYPKQFWAKDSLYLSDDENGIAPLIPYLSKVFQSFAYYGPNQISLAQWDEVFSAYKNDPARDRSIERFFYAVQKWLRDGNQDAQFFWILGI